MMGLWKSSYARRSAAALATFGALSVVVHTGVIAGWVLATLPRLPGTSIDDISNRVYFIPPPDRAPSPGGSAPTVHYIDLSKSGPALGDGPRMMGDARPVAPAQPAGNESKDTTVAPSAPVAPPAPPPDSVYSILEVDTAVVRSANSAAPAYPLNLLQAHITGYVQARYVVDTTGFADSASFIVLKSTNAEFITAVREALPYMRFVPAKIGRLRVRQLVEQQFSFKITDTTTAASPVARTKKPRA